jgi:hypothetical protein
MSRKAVHRREIFPLSVFAKPPSSVAFIDYSYVPSQDFFEVLKKLCRAMHVDGFSFLTTDPDPGTYYDMHFHWLPGAWFSRDDAAKTYTDFMMHDPGKSPADAISYRADEVMIVSDSSSFICYGTRVTDLVVVALWGNPLQLVDNFIGAWRADFNGTCDGI